MTVIDHGGKRVRQVCHTCHKVITKDTIRGARRCPKCREAWQDRYYYHSALVDGGEVRPLCERCGGKMDRVLFIVSKASGQPCFCKHCTPDQGVVEATA